MAERGVRVLVVDDDDFVRRALRRLLWRYGQIDEAAGVADALAKLDAAHYEVVISDERMPDGSGQELLERVRLNQPSSRRVLMSAEATRDDAGSGAYEFFFRKPDDVGALVRWLRAIAGL